MVGEQCPEDDGSDARDHRGIKQFCGVERAPVRAARAQRNHIGLCLRALLRFERHCYHAGVGWFEAKTADDPARRAGLFGQSTVHVTGNCVTPKMYTLPN